jgi:hypothetical protein
LMGRCRATKASGEPCRGTATGPHGLCWAHAPENAEQRRRGAQRGGKAKASGEIRDLKKQLEDLARDVLAGTVDRGNAVVVNQILNTRARLIEIERKIREAEEIEARIDALERAAAGRDGGERWGA